MSKPSKPKLPPPPDPIAIPEVGEETKDTALRRARGRKGFFRTILAGALAPERGQTTLGA